MKLVAHKPRVFILLVTMTIFFSVPVYGQVYKSVDERGNVTYTDRPPEAGAEPIELRPISVIEAPAYETLKPKDEAMSEDEAGEEMSLSFLRRSYKDFAISSPSPEESVWHPETAVTTSWTTGHALKVGMRVTIYLNGNEYAKTNEHMVSLGMLDRGEHTIQATLTDARNRRIATAEPVTFFVRQPTVFTARPRPTPRGGG